MIYGVIIGYHGCDKTTAERVLTGVDDLSPGKHEYDWLGKGVYFWEDSEARAWEWADELKVKGLVKSPAVIGAIIKPGNCLNLVDPQAAAIVSRAHDHYLRTCKENNIPAKENAGPKLFARYLDYAVFNTLHGLLEADKAPPYDTIRAFFTEGEPIYATSGLRTLDHVQIVVRNPKNSILGYFKPRQR
ncbi:MAG: hypothetical protein WC708_21800 [Lentisphaeria bacterium]